jgi:serine/threonine protein kinase
MMLNGASLPEVNKDATVFLECLERIQHHKEIVLVKEDFDAIDLQKYALKLEKNRIEVIPFLQLAVRLTAIYSLMHRRQLIHADIKPANVLINPETQAIKVMDFSLRYRLFTHD